MLIVLTHSMAQGEIKLIGEANVMVDGDRLDLVENNVVYMDLSHKDIVLSTSPQSVRFNINNGLRIFQFEKEGIYKRIEYTYLLTDNSRNFLAELKFLVKEDGDRFINDIKSIADYKEGYASRQ